MAECYECAWTSSTVLTWNCAQSSGTSLGRLWWLYTDLSSANSLEYSLGPDPKRQAAVARAEALLDSCLTDEQRAETRGARLLQRAGLCRRRVPDQLRRRSAGRRRQGGRIPVLPP